MISSIGILGCGWLGLPLGKMLVEKGYLVSGTTTTTDKLESLKSVGITPFKIAFNPFLEGAGVEKFLDVDLLIINIPPSLRTKPEFFHIEQMQELKKYLFQSRVKHILYISSTSIYPDLGREVNEGDIMQEHQADNKTLFVSEELFRKERQWNTTIVRCAGLAGYDRNLVRHFAGKQNLKGGNAPVNLIHRDDVLQILSLIIENNYWNQTINISAPGHPMRKDLYPELARKYQYEIPVYDPRDQSSFKVIGISKLLHDLKYAFKFPDPLDFYYTR